MNRQGGTWGSTQRSNKSHSGHFLAAVNMFVVLAAWIMDAHGRRVLLWFSEKRPDHLLSSYLSSLLWGTTRLDGRYQFVLVCLGGSLQMHMPKTPPRGDARKASEPNARTYSAGSSWRGEAAWLKVPLGNLLLSLSPAPRRKLISAACLCHLILSVTSPISAEAAPFCLSPSPSRGDRVTQVSLGCQHLVPYQVGDTAEDGTERSIKNSSCGTVFCWLQRQAPAAEC